MVDDMDAVEPTGRRTPSPAQLREALALTHVDLRYLIAISGISTAAAKAAIDGTAPDRPDGARLLEQATRALAMAFEPIVEFTFDPPGVRLLASQQKKRRWFWRR